MRSIVRRETGEGYQRLLLGLGLAKASAIETPTREELAWLDRMRESKGWNAEWVNRHEPDGRIAKMKDGSTHLAHKAEHAMDMDTGGRGGGAASRRPGGYDGRGGRADWHRRLRAGR